VQARRQQDSRFEGMWNQVNICIVRDDADLPRFGEAAGREYIIVYISEIP